MATVTLRPFGRTRARSSARSRSSPCSCASSRRRSAGCCRAIGIAGMDRVARFNVLAMSGRAVEASGDVDVILLDKTGTITYGNRLAASITAAPGVAERDALPPRSAPRSGTRRPRGARSSSSARTRLAELHLPGGGRRRGGASPRSPRRSPRRSRSRAETRTSGVRTADGVTILKGAVDAIEQRADGSLPAAIAGRIGPDRRRGRHAPGPASRRRRARADRAQGHGQGGPRSSGSPSSAGWASARS